MLLRKMTQGCPDSFHFPHLVRNELAPDALITASIQNSRRSSDLMQSSSDLHIVAEDVVVVVFDEELRQP